MSEASAADNKIPPAPAEILEGETKRYFTFFNVILALTGLTFIELILIILPFHAYVLLAALFILSAIKFVLVIWYFMHLRWDQRMLTALFLLGLFLAGGTVTALFYIFPPGESVADEVEQVDG